MLTFDQLPQKTEEMLQQLQRVESMLLKLTSIQTKDFKTDQWFDIGQLCDYHPDRPARPTVYAMVSNKVIPYHKTGKKLRFLKSEIDAWLLKGRGKTAIEMDAERKIKTDTFLSSSKRKK